MPPDTGSSETQLPPDCHTPTPKGCGSGRERCHDSHGTPTEVWEPQPLSMDELKERLLKAVAETVRRREQRKAVREAFKHRRMLGLPRRHAAKLNKE